MYRRMQGNLYRDHLLLIIFLVAERKVIIILFIVITVVRRSRGGSGRSDGGESGGEDNRGGCRDSGSGSHGDRGGRDTSRGNRWGQSRVGDAENLYSEEQLSQSFQFSCTKAAERTNLANVDVGALAVDVRVVRPQHGRVDAEGACDGVADVTAFHNVGGG